MALRELNATNSSFAFALGDMGYGTVNESTWCGKFHEHFSNVEILAGRSDVGQPPTPPVNINNFVNDCPFTLNVPAIGVYGKEYYFDYPSDHPLARFILISPDLQFYDDPGTPLYNYSKGTAHYNWTAQAIDDARALGIPWVIVGSSKVCISASEHPCEITPDLFNLLLRKKVDLIVQGSVHNYERSKQLAVGGPGCADGIKLANYSSGCVAADGARGAYQKGNGTVVVMSGTGGRDFLPFDTTNPYSPYFAKWLDNTTQSNWTFSGVTTVAVSATQLSEQTHFNTTASDNFTITQAAGSSTSLPPASGLGLLTYVAIVAVIAVIAVVVAILVIWRRGRRKSKPKPSVRSPPAAEARAADADDESEDSTVGRHFE